MKVAGIDKPIPAATKKLASETKDGRSHWRSAAASCSHVDQYFLDHRQARADYPGKTPTPAIFDAQAEAEEGEKEREREKKKRARASSPIACACMSPRLVEQNEKRNYVQTDHKYRRNE